MMSARAEVRLLCERGNLDRLKLVLNRINSSHKVTKSSSGDLDTLLAVGPNQGSSPLFVASQFGHLAIVRYLVEEHGCAVDMCPSDLSTPLCAACRTGNPEIVQYLVGHGANVNHATRERNTPFCIALVNENIEIARILATHGADVNVPNTEGITAVFQAAAVGDTRGLRFLLDECNADAKFARRGGATPLHAAAMQGHVQAAELLLNANADPFASLDNNGDIPLNWVVNASEAHRHLAELLAIRMAQEHARDALLLAPSPTQIEVALLFEHPVPTSAFVSVVAPLSALGIAAVCHRPADVERIAASTCVYTLAMYRTLCKTSQLKWSPWGLELDADRVDATLAALRTALMPWSPARHGLFHPGATGRAISTTYPASTP
eukprot:m.193518 g.193518  ORF g.193518 m.193518 type:complete len:379 (-) comp24983_c0_seq2:214-1350(-)